MADKLVAKIFDFFITTRCTMNCKLCAAAVPYIKKPCHTPKEQAFREIEKFFEIWDYAERVEFIGGEPLMHPDIYEIVYEALKYKDQFGKLRITTNATIVPDDKLLALARDCGKEFDFIIDDYGKYSVNLNRLLKKLDEYDLPYRVDVYHGDNQRYNGWVYFGDYTDRGYASEEEVKTVFENCICPKTAFVCVNDGKAFSCVYSMSLWLVKGVLPQGEEYIDLFDESITIPRKRKIADTFCTRAISSCRYCYGFNSESGMRYSAAEQLPRRTVQ